MAEWVFCGGLLIGIVGTFVRAVARSERRVELRVLTRERARRAERVAVAASVDDPAFSPEVIRASVTEMLDAAEGVWAGRDDREYRRRSDIQLIREWAVSRGEQIGKGLRIVGRPNIEVVGVVNRAGENEDRAVVRMHLRIHRDPKASANERGDGTILAQRIAPIEERWTLARRSGQWRLAAIGGDTELDVRIHSPLIATPAEDEGRVRESALREVAGVESTPTANLGELISPDLAAPDQLRELSVLDDRFSPDLLAAALRHLVQAWEDYADGSRQPLEEVATARAIQALVHPGHGRREDLIRDAELATWKVLHVDPGPRAPRIRVQVEVRSAAVAGDGRWNDPSPRRVKQALVWTLELEGDEGHEPGWKLTRSVVA